MNGQWEGKEVTNRPASPVMRDETCGGFNSLSPNACKLLYVRLSLTSSRSCRYTSSFQEDHSLLKLVRTFGALANCFWLSPSHSLSLMVSTVLVVVFQLARTAV